MRGAKLHLVQMAVARARWSDLEPGGVRIICNRIGFVQWSFFNLLSANGTRCLSHHKRPRGGMIP